MVMRRRRAWSDTLVSATLAASATLKFDLLATLTPSDTKTVTRVVLDITATPPVTNSLADRVNVVHVGIGVVSLEAFNLETLPDMNAVADYPQQGWLYVATQRVFKQAEAGILTILPAHFSVDLRAQRKVDRGVLFMSLLNIGNNGVDNVDWFGRVRALCLT